MGILAGMIEWSREVFLPFGYPGLFLVAFMESAFFPIPPDAILIPLCLINPEMALFYALVSTAGSVTGSLLGYFIGIKGGRPVLLKFAKEERIMKVEKYFNKYGSWAVGIAGFTPIPYKVFTIASGVFEFDIKKMLIVSAISRGARFFLEAVVIMIWGAQIVSFMDSYFEFLTILGTAVIVGLYVAYKKFKTNRQKSASLKEVSAAKAA